MNEESSGMRPRGMCVRDEQTGGVTGLRSIAKSSYVRVDFTT